MASANGTRSDPGYCRGTSSGRRSAQITQGSLVLLNLDGEHPAREAQDRDEQENAEPGITQIPCQQGAAQAGIGPDSVFHHYRSDTR